VLNRPKISICIPAYNRSKFLNPLLDSIVTQDADTNDFEIVIAEDKSKERAQIKAIIDEYVINNSKISFIYHENETNLGYDRNIKNLIDISRGEYCFFMGNDDIMAIDAIKKVIDTLGKNKNIGVIIRSYDWFDFDYKKPIQQIKYFSEDRVFQSGSEAISFAFRRSGVISGYIVNRDIAVEVKTDQFDGILFYQMYLSCKILQITNAFYISQILTHSRSTETPDFGNTEIEKKHFTPGHYSPSARIQMISGMLLIARGVNFSFNTKIYYLIENDIANHIYPYISDQLNLRFLDFFNFYYTIAKFGLWKYPLFHIHMIFAYILKEEKYDFITKIIRNLLGKTLILSQVGRGKTSS
jgi:abequosyltransferase